MTGVAPRCPYCGEHRPPGTGSCSGCGGDLTPLRRVEELADRFFNDGLEAAARRDWAVARENLAVAVVLNPSDAEAAVLLGKVRYRHGDRGLAVETWNRVLRADPDHDGARAALEYASARRAPGPARPSGRRRSGAGR